MNFLKTIKEQDINYQYPILNSKIIKSLVKQNPCNEKELSRAKRKLARDFGIGIKTNRWFLKIYREILSQKKIKSVPVLENLLVKRPIRTLSGVAPLTVLTKPYPCPGKCIYCPNESKMPKSYLASQPAAARAKLCGFHPYRQVQVRLRSYYENGHQPEKVELIVLGGTWSAYPKRYQAWFVKELYHALNEFSLNLVSFPCKLAGKTNQVALVQQSNERAQHRCIGLTIETRPDYVNLLEIRRLRRFGVTRVELGIQTIYDDILKENKRGHWQKDIIKATKLLKDAGFKIVYHMMPGLLGSTPAHDLQMFEELFNNSDFQPDQLKIYPCVVLKNSPLYKLWHKGEFKPLEGKSLEKLLIKIKSVIPSYVRVERVFRDIPSNDIVAGNKMTNFRELLHQKMKEQSLECKCIRCREVGLKFKVQNSKFKMTNQNLKLFIEQYSASDGIEYFISFESQDRKSLYAFIRLRLPSNGKEQLSVLRHTAIIRELHTYGQLAPLTINNSAYTKILADKQQLAIHAQHKGLGKKLMRKAEQIAKQEGSKKIAVISGAGVREYYRKLGYAFDEKYGYMIKDF